MDTPKIHRDPAEDHQLIRLDAQEHPERTPSQHEDAARTIAAAGYVEDMRRIQRREVNEEEV